MSSSRTLSTLLAVLSIYAVLGLDEDFAFDVSDDLEVEFPPDTPKKLWGMSNDITATVGRVFHLAVPKDSSGDSFKHYEARSDQNNPLPSWLLFDKTGGVFWGVPLEEDVGILHISVKAVRQYNNETDTFTLTVTDDHEPEGVEKCPSNEDNTVLTLIIDKSIKAIKPKQRIVSINNIAKFFGLPYNAFILKPEEHPDDITDSSVVLAGPGNLKTRTSKSNSLIQATVGCEGRLWLNSAPIVHQLKQQARDGTISEVLRLPLVGWRVKTETRPLLRKKRQDDAFVGSGDSGDYEEYYEEYDDYDNPDEDPEDNDLITPTSTTTSTTPITTHVYPGTTSESSETHPHRHHHGEVRPFDETEPSVPFVPIASSEESTASPKTEEEIDVDSSPDYVVPQETSPLSPQTPGTTIQSTESTTTSTTTTTTTQTPSTTQEDTEETKPEIITPLNGLYNPSETLDSDDEYDYDDEDDDESATDVPILPPSESSPTVDHTNAVVPETETTQPVTTKEVVPETLPTIRTTTDDLITTIVEEIIPIYNATSTSTEPPPTTTPSTATTTTTTERFVTDDDEEEFSTIRHTTLRHTITSSTTTQKATTPQVTESIEYEVKNFAPTVQIRLNRIPVTAGKNFSQAVPENMFIDMEDGTKLKLDFLDRYGNPVKENSWCQFNPSTREIYGLPLGDDISSWEYILKATDKEGASVSERIEIVVQQHKYWRVVNHEFTLYVRVEKKQSFLHPVDWSLHILKGIANVYRTNISMITVRNISYATDPMIFTWTNDSLATKYCPKTEIDQLFSMLTANDEGDPSITLSHNLSPELRAKKITQNKMGVCEETEAPLPPPPPLTPITPPSNLAPILRNPVDHINATVGELLLFTVRDDTFYDPEDVNGRDLILQLYTIDKQPILANHWLQFDSKNREFFGIPSPRESRRTEYQLICKDSGGLTASDTLVVEVHPAPGVNYNVEFSMTIETDYDAFATSALHKRKFVEKLQEVFGDPTTSHIHLSAITKGSSMNKDATTVTWYNKTLTKEDCPWDDIRQLESILVNERIISNRVQDIMGPEFPVLAFKPQNLGSCRIPPTPPRTGIGRDNSPSVHDTIQTVDEGATQESQNEYLITFIVPAVIISAMLLLAGIAACVLYRRRRSGKMNIEEDGRQSYGNKGIPVIFQEELDEKPESGTKTPVILKDEKPPLAPPEYSKSGSLKLTDDSEPYQPPPPFARSQDNGRQPRPKPTPTYRKPPPYVPP